MNKREQDTIIKVQSQIGAVYYAALKYITEFSKDNLARDKAKEAIDKAKAIFAKNGI